MLPEKSCNSSHPKGTGSMAIEGWNNQTSIPQQEAAYQSSLGSNLLNSHSLLSNISPDQMSERDSLSHQTIATVSSPLFERNRPNSYPSILPESNISTVNDQPVVGKKTYEYVPPYLAPDQSAAPHSSGRTNILEHNSAAPRTEITLAPVAAPNTGVEKTDPSLVTPSAGVDRQLAPVASPFPQTEKADPIVINPAGNNPLAPQTQRQPNAQQSVKDKLDAPYESETNSQVGKLFEPIWRAGAYGFWLHKDGQIRPQRLEKWIQNQDLVSEKNYSSFLNAQEKMLEAVKTPLGNATENLQKVARESPELFQSNGQGHRAWQWEAFKPEQEAVANRWLNLKSLENDLKSPWQIKDVTMRSKKLNSFGVVYEGSKEPIQINESKLAKIDWLKEEGLAAHAQQLDDAFDVVVQDANFARTRFEKMRIDARGETLKSAGLLGASWITNAVTDTILDTKKGPSALTYATDLIAPMIVLTDKNAWVKFAVLTIPHIITKAIEKSSEHDGS